MRGERGVLRLGEFLVGRASLRLPPAAREERYREWVAELPAILHDPGTRPGWLRAARMLGYAADTLRAAALARGRGHRAGPAWLSTVRNSRGLLALVAVEMSLQAVVVYLAIFGTRLEVYAAMWATAIAALTHHLFTRRAWSLSSPRIMLACWLLWTSWNLFAVVARKFGWPAGPAVLGALTTYAMSAIILIEVAGMIRSARRRRRLSVGKTR